jgi:hypothetical protein
LNDSPPPAHPKCPEVPAELLHSRARQDLLDVEARKVSLHCNAVSPRDNYPTAILERAQDMQTPASLIISHVAAEPSYVTIAAERSQICNTHRPAPPAVFICLNYPATACDSTRPLQFTILTLVNTITITLPPSIMSVLCRALHASAQLAQLGATQLWRGRRHQSQQCQSSSDLPQVNLAHSQT